MQIEELRQLVERVQQVKTESQTLEVKKALGGCPRLYDTLSSFSNQDGGGVVLFGVDESAGFSVCGVYDANDLQKRIAEQCKEMEPPVRAFFTVCQMDGKTVVAAEIPGMDVSDRPVHYRGVGRVKGSYVRVGDADEQMTEYEVYGYEAYRRRVQDDLEPVERGSVADFNADSLAAYLRAVRAERPKLNAATNDASVLAQMGVTAGGRPTRAGWLVFADYPQSAFPQFSVTAVSLPGTEQGFTGSSGERFIDNKRLTGSIGDMLEATVEFVQRNSRTKTIIDANGRRVDRCEYPLPAVREAVLNALIHRDYGSHTEGTPIVLEMYRDRMEIASPGGLYGRLTLEALGKIRPETRNTTLVNILELLGLTENRYSGIPVMRRAMEEAGLPPPEFSVRHGEFKVILWNDYGEKKEPTKEPLLEFCRTPRTRAEIVAHVGRSQNHVMSKIVAPLVAEGRLRLTIPDHPRSPLQRYVANDRL